jgi:hypothetical protein
LRVEDEADRIHCALLFLPEVKHLLGQLQIVVVVGLVGDGVVEGATDRDLL